MGERKVGRRSFLGFTLLTVILTAWTETSHACIVPERRTTFGDFALRSDVVVEAISTEYITSPKRYNATFRVTHLFSSKHDTLKIGEEIEVGEFGGSAKCFGPKPGESYILFLSSIAAFEAPWLSRRYALRYNPVATSSRNLRFFEEVIQGTYAGDPILRSGCKSLPKTEKGFVICTPNKKRCIVSCKKGFKLEGVKIKTCQPKTGWWYPFKPASCVPEQELAADAAITPTQDVETSTDTSPSREASTETSSTSNSATTATPSTPKQRRAGKWRRRGAARRRSGQQRAAAGFRTDPAPRIPARGRGRGRRPARLRRKNLSLPRVGSTTFATRKPQWLRRGPTTDTPDIEEEEPPKVPKKKRVARRRRRRKPKKPSPKPHETEGISPVPYTPEHPLIAFAPRPLQSSMPIVRIRPTMPTHAPVIPLAKRMGFRSPTETPLPQSVAILKKVPREPIVGEELDNIDDKFAMAKDGDKWEDESGLTYKPELTVNKTVYGCPTYESDLTVFSFWPGGYNAMVNFSRLTKPMANGWMVKVEFDTPIEDIEAHAVNFYVGTEDKRIASFTPKPYLAILHYNQDLTIAFIARINQNDATVPKGKGYLLGKCLDEEVYEKVVGNMFQGHKVVTSFGPDSKPQDVPVAPTRPPVDQKTPKPVSKGTTERTPLPRRGLPPKRGITQRRGALPKSTSQKGKKQQSKGQGQQQRRANTRSASTVDTKPKISWKENRCMIESPNGATPIGGFTRPVWTKPTKQKSKYDYNEVLHKSGLFYAAQRSGKLPKVFSIPWRADSALKDGCDAGIQLQGGLYSGGGHEKSTIAIAFTTTTLAWGGIDYKAAYEAAGEYENLLKLIKNNARYLIRCHTGVEELVVQVGNHDFTGTTWSRPEDISTEGRVVYKINTKKPGQDAAAETAAALAATAIIFKTKDAEFSKQCLQHAKELYSFARKNPGQYSRSLPEEVNNYYTLSDTLDDLIWALLWIGKATGSKSYLATAEKMFAKLPKDPVKSFYWADKSMALPVLLAKLTMKKEYRGPARRVVLNLRNSTRLTSKQVWLSDKGPNMHTANAAFLALQTALLFRNTPFASIAASFGEEQLHLLLGDSGRSFVAGFGKDSPKRPYHMASSCMDSPAKCDSSVLTRSADNAHILHGALVAGPDQSGRYRDLLAEKVYNEVAVDFNAGFQSAVAGLRQTQLPGKSLMFGGPGIIRRIGQPVRKTVG